MANQGNTPDIWLPTGALPKQQTPVRHKNPFEALSKKLAEMGFKCQWRHDQTERVIEFDFVPLTDKMKQAVKVAAQSSQATSLRTFVHYGVLDDPGQAALAALEKGLEELRQAL